MRARRFGALLLLFCITLQSSGAAAQPLPADTTSALSGVWQNMRASFAATPLFALITGKYDRYAAMHAPPPIFPHVTPTAGVMQISRGLPPRYPAPGGVVTPVHLDRPEDPRVLHPDPRAMRRLLPYSLKRTRGVISTMTVQPGSDTSTGINPWWEYEEGAIPGGGRWIVNVANGNLVVQYDDMDVPNKGIDLAFRRTYNSMSTHDYANTDGSIPSSYGDGWTNTWDAHVALNSAGGISVFDIDGARYDYTPDGKGGWIPPAGQHAILSSDGSGNYYWTKKTGTKYYFYSPSLSGTQAALSGRLIYIYGRNQNTYLHFTYSCDGSNCASASALNEIDVTTEAGSNRQAEFCGFRKLDEVPPSGQADLSRQQHHGDLHLHLRPVAVAGESARQQRGQRAHAVLRLDDRAYARERGQSPLRRLVREWFAHRRRVCEFLGEFAWARGASLRKGLRQSHACRRHEHRAAAQLQLRHHAVLDADLFLGKSARGQRYRRPSNQIHDRWDRSRHAAASLDGIALAFQLAVVGCEQQPD